LNVTNHGPDVALDVNVTDILPNEVTFVDSNLLPSGNNGQTYWWVISSIDVNESVIIRINVTINDGVSGTITNTATVEDDSYDPDDENNEDYEDVTVDKKGGGGGGGPPGGGGTPPPENKIPTAKTDGPYYGFIGEEIQFNATESHDNDENGESIESYDWKFFDEDGWRNDLGATPTYIYNETGRYNISLRVTDDESATNINTTFALIAKPNTPPSKPEVTGPQNGTINVSYNFTVVSTDEDGDEIKYTIDWGDGNTTESDFLPSGVPFIAAHKWINSGEYTIKITADDNSTITTDELTIEIIDPEPKPTKAEDNMWWLLLLLLIIILLIIILLLYKRHRDKKKAQKPDKVAAKTKQTTKQ
jgi:hypothetical protein